MANVLTGDFDVVAQFALPAVNRVLAAMHRVERFPHSIAARVDDTPRPGPKIDPSFISVVNAFGDVPASQEAVGNPSPLGPSRAPSFLDPVVNIGNAVIGPSPIVPSNLKGIVQLQVFPPELEVPDASGTHLTVAIGMLSRYFPDHGTSALAEYIRGDLRVTVPVNQVASQIGNVVDVDIKASTAVINFTPQWSSRPLSAEDMAAINLVIRNSLKTSFLPSNATLPSQISHMQFRTLSGSQNAVAVMLDLDGAAGNPASISDVFLSGSDGFAFGVGADYLRAALQPTLDNILSQPIPSITIERDLWFHTYHITYTVTLNTATLELESGDILFQITGHAHTPTSWMPDFDFTVRQELTLGITGDSAELVMGSMTIDTSSWVLNLFKGAAQSSIESIRDQALAESGAQSTVRNMLSASGNLGGFLQSLLKPASGSTNTQPLSITLGYTAAEIRPSGIVLHGSVAVPQWTPPQVEFEEIPVSPNRAPGAGGAVANGPDYSALNTWIPGGKITQYSWHLENGAQSHIETNKFVFIDEPSTTVASAATVSGEPPRALSLRGYNPMCLTVTGTRPSEAGAVTTQAVSGSVCAGLWFPVAGGLETSSAAVIAMTRPGPEGNVEVIGHAPTASRIGGYDSPNMIIHFAAEAGRDDTTVLSRALANSGRDDAPTGILVVMRSTQLATARWVDGIIYAEDDNGAWRKRFGVTEAGTPVTIVADPDGRVLWKSDGRTDVNALSEALRKFLVKRSPVKPVILAAGSRIGHVAPNFLFEYAAGQELTLRKVAGRPALLIFWRSASAASIEAVRMAAQSTNKERHNALVFAINSGEEAEVVRRLAREVGPHVTIVTDTDERISEAYGITMWPTLIAIDDAGIVRSIQYGRTQGGKSHA